MTGSVVLGCAGIATRGCVATPATGAASRRAEDKCRAGATTASGPANSARRKSPETAASAGSTKPASSGTSGRLGPPPCPVAFPSAHGALPGETRSNAARRHGCGRLLRTDPYALRRRVAAAAAAAKPKTVFSHTLEDILNLQRSDSYISTRTIKASIVLRLRLRVRASPGRLPRLPARSGPSPSVLLSSSILWPFLQGATRNARRHSDPY